MWVYFPPLYPCTQRNHLSYRPSGEWQPWDYSVTINGSLYQLFVGTSSAVILNKTATLWFVKRKKWKNINFVYPYTVIWSQRIPHVIQIQNVHFRRLFQFLRPKLYRRLANYRANRKWHESFFGAITPTMGWTNCLWRLYENCAGIRDNLSIFHV